MQSNRQHVKAATRGVSLVEVCIVLAVVAIIATVATPALNVFVLNNRLSANVNALVADLQAARSEAGTRGQSVTLCPMSASNRQAACGGSWAGERIVFVESDNSVGATLGVLNEGDARLKSTPAGATGTSITLDPPLASITFRPSGQIESPGDAIRFTICDARRDAREARVLTLLRTGRTIVNRATDIGVGC